MGTYDNFIIILSSGSIMGNEIVSTEICCWNATKCKTTMKHIQINEPKWKEKLSSTLRTGEKWNKDGA